MTLCVYALAATADRTIPVAGMKGEPLRVLRAGGVAAIVGDIARAPKPSPRTLREYDRVQQELARRLPATLPARFGTCFDDEEDVMLVLRGRQRPFQAALRHVRGRAQMTVRLVKSQSRTANCQLPTPNVEEIASGAAYLKAKAAEKDVPEFAPVRAAVRRWVRDERVETRGRVVSVYHLVPRRSADAYRRALEQAAASAGLRVVVSGPWPPYAFTTPI